MALEGELDGEWGENTTLDQLLNDIFQDPTISAFLNKSLNVDTGNSEAAPQPPPYTASVGSPTPPSTTTSSWRPWCSSTQAAPTSHVTSTQVMPSLADSTSSSLAAEDNWYDYNQFTNIEVILKAVNMPGKRGVVRSISNFVASVRLYNSGQDIRILCNFLQPTTPQRFDLIKVIAGPSLGKVGTLVDIVDNGAIVQLQPSNGHIVNNVQIPLGHLGKLVPQAPTSRPAHLFLNTQHVTQPQVLRKPCSPYTPSFYSPTSPRYPPSYPFPSRSHQQPPPYPQVLSPHSTTSTPLYHLSSPMHTQTPSTVVNLATSPCAQSPCAQSPCVQSPCAQSPTSHMRTFFSKPMMQPMLQQLFKPNGRMKTDVLVSNTSHGTGEVCQPSKLSPVDKATWMMMEEVLKRPPRQYNFSSVAGNSDVKSTWEQVTLICPLSQKRMTYPCRSVHCKHLQCFDAEAYISFNHTQKLKPKLKAVNCSSLQLQADKRWKCPLCHKPAPYNHLYIDKILQKIVRETKVNEVEFDKNGLWRPVEKPVKQEVIDLTCDSDDET